MATPANKRRKTEHFSSDEELSEDSFASFGSDQDGNDSKEEHERSSQNDINKDHDVFEGAADREFDRSDDNGGSGEGSGLSDDEKVPNATERKPGHNAQQHVQKQRRASSTALRESASYTSGTFKSNIFKLQVDDLLAQIRPKHGSKEAAAEESLHRLKKSIEGIPARGPMGVDDAERQLLTSSKVSIPFSDPRPPSDAKYKLEYAPPSNINVVGSHAAKTRSRVTRIFSIDMAVTMPSSLFQEKDYLNHRYFYKRAYYLARIAAGLKDAHAKSYSMQFRYAYDDPLKPILVVRPNQQDDDARPVAQASKWQINIVPCVSADIFSKERLLPDKNCVRQTGATVANVDFASKEQFATPFYDSSLRSDMLVTPYLKLLHSASTGCAAFQDACLLGSTWLRQRGLDSNIHAGGFGNFEWSVLTALMLESGGPNGRPILSKGYSSYQVLRATLQLLATKDFDKQPFFFGTNETSKKPEGKGTPIAWDAFRSYNVLSKMTPWSYSSLRHEARTTLTMLSDQHFDGFDATFILRIDSLLYRYDYVVELESSMMRSGETQHTIGALYSQRNLYEVLRRGLGDRVKMIDIKPQWSESWQIGSAGPNQRIERKVRVCFIVNPGTVGRAVDHGPSADNKSEAAAFRKFWGEKAELRRFKDGSIRESVVWSSHGRPVFEQIVRYLIQRHYGEKAESNTTFSGDLFGRILAHPATTAPFQPVVEAFKQFERDIRSLEDTPLSVRQITPADAQLRSTSIILPANGERARPADLIIQFEGSSRWPDDLVAIQKTKIAFLLKLANLLQESKDSITGRVGLENEGHHILNQGFLEVVYDSGMAFHIRVHHDREQTLLEQRLRDKTLDARSKEVAALGLADYKRDYIKAPTLTQAIAGLCSRFPALSGSIRLVKKWFASHLLSNHVADEVIEMLVAQSFLQSWPWQAPATIQTGFLRTLFWISRWDWRADPLIVDLSGSGELKQLERQAITSRFEAWRKLDPALSRVVLFVASNLDPDGTTWTDGRPQKVVAGRMSALAKAACADVEQKQMLLEPGGLFSSPLSDFDFVIHLKPSLIKKKLQSKKAANNGATFKNLEIDLGDDASLPAFDALQSFIYDLESSYGSAILFFSGASERPAIAGLWTPQTVARNWKLHLPYSTLPRKAADPEDIQAELNQGGILAEIARLGDDIVDNITVNRH